MTPDRDIVRRRRGPRPISEAVATLRSQTSPPTLLAAVQACWEDVAGPEIAAHAVPVREHQATVTVACDSSVWAAELDLMAPQLLERLNEALGVPIALSELRFTAADRAPQSE
jgi:predicted nucleic acid-binding Zn ribbon protein